MNSGAKNYDQADLMLYLMALDSAYMYWNWMKRIYGYLRTYSQYNKYMPRAYAEAESLQFDDLISNLSDFRLYINQTAAKLSAFCVPAVFPLFIRHSWMCSNIYKDSGLLKSQQYMFIPSYVYKYDETGSEYGGQLIPVQVTGFSTYLKFSDIVTTMNSIIDAIAYSEDIGVMSGDILKAYGQEKLFKLPTLEPDYMVEPVYNEEVLNQMHNSTTTVPFNVTTSWKITQDPTTGFLTFNPSFAPTPVVFKRQIINMPWDNVTPANTMVGTRLITVLKENSQTSIANPELDACGSEIVIKNRILTMFTNGTFGVLDVSNHNFLINTNISGSSNPSLPFGLVHLGRVSQFDWHPLYYMWAQTAEHVFTYCGTLGDVSNYTLMNSEDISKLHYTAIMSEFNIPQIGSF